MSRLLAAGGVRQNGYVVDDLDDAVARWVSLGAGPFFVIRHLPLSHFLHLGRESDPDLSIALGNLGDLQIELIQQHNAAPSPYRHFLDERGPGLQHVSAWSTTYDATLAAAEQAERRPDTVGQIAGSARFVYFDATRLDSTCLEVSDLGEQGEFGVVHALVRDVHLQWDGAEPVREFALS
ncbi:VOC family protein [Nocardioides fonticola]|uniref:VOC family protein n=1 Tax=Nocardioides fonticola TaxID=450363 RepID=A0ABP7XK03_9ACTN